MLRYYESQGLLQPETVGENGYRYYKQEQLADALWIGHLRRYGFTLAEVKELLKLPEDELLRRLHRRRLDAHYEIYRLQEKLRELEEKPHYMKSTDERLDLRHGLGLLLVRQIVEAHGGTMKMESTPQNGYKTILAFQKLLS